MRIFLLITFAVLSSAQAEWKSTGSLGLGYSQYDVFSTMDLVGKLRSNWDGTDSLRFRSNLDLQTDFLSKEIRLPVQINAQSFYLEKSSSVFDLRLGYQTVKPDGPDFFNPADVVSPKNWTDPTNPRALGSPALSVSRDWDSWSGAVYFIPQQTEPLMPGERSLWWPRENRLPIETVDVEMRLPASVSYQLQPGVELDRARQNNFALQLQHKSEVFEFQLIGFEGLANNPYLLLDVQTTALSLGPPLILAVDSPVRLSPLYYRHQAVAATWLVTLPWDILFRGGVQGLKPMGNDSRIPSASSSRVLGFEKSFEFSSGPLTIISEWITETRSTQAQISFLRSIFENAIALGARKAIGENTQVYFGGLIDQPSKSWLARALITQKLSDSFTVELNGQVLSGPSSSLLGLYDRYDRWGTSVSWYF